MWFGHVGGVEELVLAVEERGEVLTFGNHFVVGSADVEAVLEMSGFEGLPWGKNLAM